MIIVAPGFPPDIVQDSPVETIDLMPTLLDLVGVPVPDAVQGESLAPTLLGGPPSSLIAFGESPFFGKRRFVAFGNFRLLLTKSSEAFEVFGYTHDPLELDDIASTTTSKIVKNLRSHLKTWQRAVDLAQLPQDTDAQVSEETIEQLRALGYVQDE